MGVILTQLGQALETVTLLMSKGSEYSGDYNELVYLRARYYAPEMGRFLTKDTWDGYYDRPQSLNPWNYVEANPVNLTDPSGNQPGTIDLGNNERDITLWMYRELRNNAWSPYTIKIHEMATSYDPFKVWDAFKAFKLLVQDRAKWDFKHRIQQELQANSFVLFHGATQFDHRWYERSVAGNIHYGYIGRAAGFSREILHGGAGYAEIIDPAHIQAGESCCICVPKGKGGCLLNGCGYFNPNWTNSWFDDPMDHTAVEAGIVMYDTYGRFLTYEGYQTTLSLYGPWLATTSEHLPWRWKNPAGQWPYKVGHFNGPLEAAFEPEIQKLLFQGKK